METSKCVCSCGKCDHHCFVPGTSNDVLRVSFVCTHRMEFFIMFFKVKSFFFFVFECMYMSP